MIAVGFKDISNMLTFESGSKLVGLEKLDSEVGGWCRELVTLLSLAPAT